MKKALISIVKAIVKTILILCIVPLVMIAMLPLSLIRLVICLVILIFKPRWKPAVFNKELPVS
jgi:uncharacterized membrane protein